MKPKLIGFEPVWDDTSTTLILGSFPSVMSRAQNFYYAHPRNRFWPLMEQDFGVKLNSVADKIAFCTGSTLLCGTLRQPVTLLAAVTKN